MERYYDLDKLTKLIEARADIMLEGREAMLYVAKWLNLLPTADVVPKSEVERLKKEIKEIIAYVKQFEGYAPYCAEELEKKYTEEIK